MQGLFSGAALRLRAANAQCECTMHNSVFEHGRVTTAGSPGTILRTHAGMIASARCSTRHCKPSFDAHFVFVQCTAARLGSAAPKSPATSVRRMCAPSAHSLPALSCMYDMGATPSRQCKRVACRVAHTTGVRRQDLPVQSLTHYHFPGQLLLLHQAPELRLQTAAPPADRGAHST